MQTAQIGHNQAPPDETVFADRMYEEHQKALDAASEAILLQPITVEDAETAKQAEDLIRTVNTSAKEVEKLRESEKEPHLRGGQIVDGFFKGYSKPLDETKNKIQKPLDEYGRKVVEAQREAQRKETERLRKEAEETAALAALQEKAKLAKADDTLEQAVSLNAQAAVLSRATEAAKPNELAKAAGFGGSLRTRWVAEDVDPVTVDLEVLRQYLKLEHIQSAANAAVADGVRVCRGVNIYEKTQSVVR